MVYHNHAGQAVSPAVLVAAELMADAIFDETLRLRLKRYSLRYRKNF